MTGVGSLVAHVLRTDLVVFPYGEEGTHITVPFLEQKRYLLKSSPQGTIYFKG